MPESAIAAVLVNWNGAEDTLRALDSLWSAAPRPRRVVVVDNGSQDGSPQAIAAWGASDDRQRWMSLLELGYNAGFAAANNAGLALLEPDPALDAFLLLNNDAVVQPDYIAVIERAMRAHPEAALLSGITYEWDRTTVWYAGGHEIPWRAVLLHDLHVPGTAPSPTEFVCGCTMLIPRATYARLGGLPDAYFIYWEDVEYSRRARALGPLLCVPDAVAYHRVNGAMGAPALSVRTAYVQHRSRALYVRRNERGLVRAIATGYLLVTKTGKCLLHVLRGNTAVGRAILSGTVAGLRGAPDPDAPQPSSA